MKRILYSLCLAMAGSAMGAGTQIQDLPTIGSLMHSNHVLLLVNKHLGESASVYLITASNVLESLKAMPNWEVGQAQDSDLDGLSGLTGLGLAIRTGAGTWALRTNQSTSAGLSIGDPSGVAGNPTFSLSANLESYAARAGTNSGIMFVREDGNNATAVVGDRDKAWRDIDAAASNAVSGAVILLGAGIFDTGTNQHGSILVSNKSLTIIGHGKGVSKITGGDPLIDAVIHAKSGAAVSLYDLSISNRYPTGASAVLGTNSGTVVVMQNCYVHGRSDTVQILDGAEFWEGNNEYSTHQNAIANFNLSGPVPRIHLTGGSFIRLREPAATTEAHGIYSVAVGGPTYAEICDTTIFMEMSNGSMTDYSAVYAGTDSTNFIAGLRIIGTGIAEEKHLHNDGAAVFSVSASHYDRARTTGPIAGWLDASEIIGGTLDNITLASATIQNSTNAGAHGKAYLVPPLGGANEILLEGHKGYLQTNVTLSSATLTFKTTNILSGAQIELVARVNGVDVTGFWPGVHWDNTGSATPPTLPTNAWFHVIITKLLDGTTNGIMTGVAPNLTAGANITVTKQSQGSWEIAASAGVGGDSIEIDGVPVTDPDFVSTGDIDFTDTANTVTADIRPATIVLGDFSDGDWGDGQIISGQFLLDIDVVGPDEIANADFGFFTFASGVATPDLPLSLGNAAGPGVLRLAEDTDNGGNYVAHTTLASLGHDLTVTWSPGPTLRHNDIFVYESTPGVVTNRPPNLLSYSTPADAAVTILDLGTNHVYQFITVDSGNIALITTNRADLSAQGMAQTLTVFLTASGAARTVTMPAAWYVFGTNATAFEIPANSRAALSLICTNTAETDVTATYRVGE